MAKNVIRLTESQLKNIIKESVKKTLKEVHNGPWYDRSANDIRYYKSDEDFNSKLSRADEDDLYNSEIGDALMSDWEKMGAKLNGKEPYDQLDSLIQTNPIYKKWYEKLHKKHESDYLWSAKKDYEDEVNNPFYKEWEMEQDYNNYRNLNLEDGDDQANGYYQSSYLRGEDDDYKMGLPESRRMSRIIKESVKKVLKGC
jgi:hypothetical protein